VDIACSILLVVHHTCFCANVCFSKGRELPHITQAGNRRKPISLPSPVSATLVHRRINAVFCLADVLPVYTTSGSEFIFGYQKCY
jgi:hypothetical protein